MGTVSRQTTLGLGGLASVVLMGGLVACNALLGNRLDDDPGQMLVTDRDGALDDVSNEADARGDDGAIADALRGCARYADASFCNDFEGADPLGPAFWTRTLGEDAGVGTITLSNDSPISPSRAAVFDLLPPDGGPCRYLQKERRIVGQYGSARVRLAVKPKGAPTFFRLVLGFGGRFFEVLVRFDVPGTSVNLVGQYTSPVEAFDNANTPLGLTRIDRWTDVALDILSEPAKKAIVTVEGATTEIGLPGAFVLDDPIFSFGPHCTSMAARFELDDVAVFLR